MSKVFLKKFAKRLKELREKKDLTQEDLACDAGISRSTIGMLEVAKRDITLSKLEKIAKALEIQPYELIKFD